MPKYRKRPVVIEALCYTGGNLAEVLAFGEPREGNDTRVEWSGGEPRIRTKEGSMALPAGNWVIRGVQDELYSCDPDIFLATYQPVEDWPRTRTGWDALEQRDG